MLTIKKNSDRIASTITQQGMVINALSVKQAGRASMSQKVTITDVAREANTSVGTVYRAVYNYGRINEKTRSRILDTVERLGYKANTVARGLALRNKFTILVIMPKEPASFWRDVLKGTQRAAERLAEFGVRVIIYVGGEVDAESGKTIMETIADERIDAIALSVFPFIDRGVVLQYATENKIPVAILNDDIIGYDPLFYYGPNNRQAGTLAGELIRKFSGGGVCCAIMPVETIKKHSAYMLRSQGFVEYLSAYCPESRYEGSFYCSPSETPSTILKLLADFPDINGIYFTDLLLLQAGLSILPEIGRKVYIIGHEYSEEFREALRNNTITALLVQEKVCQGYYPVMMLYNYLVSGEKFLENIYYSNINIILDTNADCLRQSVNGCGYE